MLEVFKHKSLKYPPVLSKGDEMCSGTKSDRAKCILPDITNSTINAQPKAASAFVDVLSLVNQVEPKKNQSFNDYSSEVFYPEICKQ